ncbi:hypothetical protein C2S53_011926 [Perilla frutescens var. hirtella]|uniref:RNase H type-1 domain-containing protein n=1 Tax=Perilla frutescens var. hirtella TaxID=608512 RepID=A0AAD4J8N6_PERFH|nr:hypothetical protein C2S53_011926 [Perilla frutescens var. hirtella]
MVNAFLGFDHELQVADLIDDEAKWRVGFIKMCTLPFESDAILNIHILVAAMRDRRFWKFDDKGRFILFGRIALSGDKQWPYPPEGCCRVDVDALFNPVLRLYGLGVVIRNSTGSIVAALAKSIKHPTSVLGAEILAAISGINLCLDEGITPVLLFSNSILTVQVLSDSNVDDCIVVDELQDFRLMVSGGLVLKVSHMYRKVNRVAHSLAQFVASLSDAVKWVSNYPPWLEHLVSLDCLND